MRDGGGPSEDQPVSGASDPSGTPIEDVGVDHRGADVPVTQQLLDGTNVVAFLQEVRGKRVPEGMARGGLGNPRAPDRVLDRPLEDRLVQVVAATLTGHAVHVEASRRKDPLPSPGAAGIRVLAQERPGQLDPARTMPKIAFVLPARTLEVDAQICLDRS